MNTKVFLMCSMVACKRRNKSAAGGGAEQKCGTP